LASRDGVYIDSERLNRCPRKISMKPALAAVGTNVPLEFGHGGFVARA